MPRSRPTLSRIAVLALQLVLAGTVYGADPAQDLVPDPAQDPAVTTYGTLNPAAPAELAIFSFIVGKWTGTGKYRGPEGNYIDFEVLWIGRYVLNGMAIADEMRRPEADGGSADGINLRFFDPVSRTWTVEFLNLLNSFLRKQANANTGAVTQDSATITVAQSGPEGAPGREVYTVIDADHFTYSMDVERDGVWDEGIVTMQLERQE